MLHADVTLHALPKNRSGVAPHDEFDFDGAAFRSDPQHRASFINVLAARAIARDSARIEAEEFDVHEQSFFENRLKSERRRVAEREKQAEDEKRAAEAKAEAEKAEAEKAVSTNADTGNADATKAAVKPEIPQGNAGRSSGRVATAGAARSGPRSKQATTEDDKANADQTVGPAPRRTPPPSHSSRIE